MNTKTWWSVAAVVVIVAVGVLVYEVRGPRIVSDVSGANTSTVLVGKDNLIQVSLPQANQVVSSPLVIEGKARGGWFFEGSFPLKIVGANGALVTSTYATAQGEWMTSDFVAFRSVVRFVVNTTTPATLILAKDNPSGLPENDDSVSIPIVLQPTVPTRVVKVFYYNPSLDEDKGGNLRCSAAGLVAVARSIPITQTPIQDAIRLVLQGQLTAAERQQGLETEFPLSGVNLLGVTLDNGVLTIDLSDPNNKTTGGACRVGILASQLIATAKQFPEVTSVQFKSENLFQP